MDIDPTKQYAVISGDFIGFSNLPLKNRQAMYFILKSGSKELAEAFPGIMPWDVDMFRGDGWQMVLTDPVCSLLAALYFKAYIRSTTAQKKIDTRMAIAVGNIDYIPENRVSAGDGAAFRMSGRLLDRISRNKSATTRFIMEDQRASTFLDRTVHHAGNLSSSWTAKQAMVIMSALRGWAHDQICSNLDEEISEKKLGRLLNLSGWPEIKHALSIFEGTLSSIIS